MKRLINIVCIITVFAIVLPEAVYAKKCSISLANCDLIPCAVGDGTCTVPEMNDFCVVPPFIQEIAKPNLLMIIDNSASMYDLAYVDKGKKHCSVSTSKSCFTDYDCSYCSSTTSTKCSVNTDCPGVETCNVTETCPTANVDRQPSYCFDETYLGRNTYVGYFENKTAAGVTQYYYYDFANEKFVADPANSITCTAAGQTLREIPGQMCVVFNAASPFTVTEFRASGGYLNWLTASKFDVEKEVLTGGKWDGTHMLPESRGCVGQRYIKKALAKHCSNSTSTSCTTDANCASGGICEEFTNFNTGVDPNPPLGITFGIRGEPDSVNKYAPSPGGQSYIDIFAGSYNQEQCQPAITAISTDGTSQTTWRDSIQTCINYGVPNAKCFGDAAMSCTIDSDCVSVVAATGTQGVCKKSNGTASATACYYDTDCPNNYPNCIGAVQPTVIDKSPCVIPAQPPETKTKIALVETVQTCWSYTRNGLLGTGDVSRLTSGGKCNDIYKAFGICSLNNNKTCSGTVPCGAGEGVCTMGPSAILGGNPAFICSPNYIGNYYTGVTPTWANTWTGTTTHCYDDTTNTIGGACGSDSDCTSPAKCQEDAVIAYRRFCNTFNAPNTIDPSDSPSTTSTSDNLPALISSIGVEGQLGLPIATLKVRIAKNTAPFGLIQEYDNKIRMGVMTFNYNGAYTESGTLYGTTVAIPPQKVCSNSLEKNCTSDFDCPTLAAGLCVPAGANIKDGAKIVAEIGKGTCVDSMTEADAGTVCTTQAHCTSSQKCKSSGAGSHTDNTSMVFRIDDIKAKAWTPFSEAFYNAIGYFAQDTSDATRSRTALRLNTTDFPDAFNPSEYPCQSNNILLITDGMSTADRNVDVNNLATLYGSASTGTQGWTVACTLPFAGSVNLDDMAWLGKHRDIKRFDLSGTASPETLLKKSESINTYVVFNGADNGQTGECNNTTILNQTANKGGTSLLKTELPEQYENTLRKAFAAVAGGTASGTAASILSNSEGSGANILQAVFYPSKEFETVSGTSTPTSASWIGEMQNLWYYVDPYIGNSSVREDTNKDSGLHIQNDYVTEFQFKGGETIAVLKKDDNKDGSGETIVTTAMDSRVKSQGYCSTAADTKCADDAGCPSGETCLFQGIVNADDINSLWRAGKQLWNRDIATSPRALYTHLYGTTVATPAVPATCGNAPLTFASNGLVNLVTLEYQNSGGSWVSLPANDKCVIITLLQAASVVEAGDILKYVQGYDHSDYDSSAAAIAGTIDGNKPRSRSVKIGASKKVWKLGDIIASTPRIQSFNKLNNFHLDAPAGYGDLTYADDSTGKGYANSTAYKARGMAYAGANDGMLHAFKLGNLAIIKSGDTKATLDGSGLGEEQWSFIPKNVLPYLKYLTDPNYSHLYLVDGPTRLLDVSIGYNDNSYIPAASLTVYATAGCDAAGSGNHTAYWACKEDSATDNNKSWRTILIGSMGIGGASAEKDAVCTNCVKNPITGVGNSSYFALDITDPEHPKFLWDFSHAEMGFATTGTAVARINHKFVSGGVTYKNTNGRWFAVIGSGPTGPIDTTYHQFKGKSDNPLHVFVLDLKTGELLKKFDTAINNSFAGSMASAPIDTDRSRKLSDGFYSDDALYFGYSNCTSDCATDTPVWNGGIMRLLTAESINPDPDWSLSTLISGVGPVSTAISKLQDRKYKNLWLYTGSGRYFFKGDDSTAPGKILAVKEPCYAMGSDDINVFDIDIDGENKPCTTEMVFSSGSFADQTSVINTMDSKKGWFIDLIGEDSVNNFGAERIITEPVAMPNGAVFFTSFMPSTDICNYGGKSYMWGMRYDTGGAAAADQLKGKALVQVSTGSFEEVNLSTALTANLGRKMTAPMIGKPPTDPPPIVSASGNKPLKRILHIQEK